MKIAVYPGSFDPPTNGHIDIVCRASKLFDRVIIAITDNPSKPSTFSINERKEMLSESTKEFNNVQIDTFGGLLVDYLEKIQADIIIRGLRAVSDFEYEFQLALMNRRLKSKIETVFLIPDESYTYLSSSIVKEIAGLGGKIKGLVPEIVAKKLKEKYSCNH
ncbi:MAG: pantetheine-phosphate adenylyltransferase [Elusimicrobiota bacterium]|nr:pantetheine-phosphate adenylyltransferase [Elusimicrobiota bacterium]